MPKYYECPDCGNSEEGDTIYQCRSCGRVACSNCANPETGQDEWEVGTCFCDGDKNDYDDGRLFSVLGHIEEKDDD